MEGLHYHKTLIFTEFTFWKTISSGYTYSKSFSFEYLTSQERSWGAEMWDILFHSTQISCWHPGVQEHMHGASMEQCLLPQTKNWTLCDGRPTPLEMGESKSVLMMKSVDDFMWEHEEKKDFSNPTVKHCCALSGRQSMNEKWTCVSNFWQCMLGQNYICCLFCSVSQ